MPNWCSNEIRVEGPKDEVALWVHVLPEFCDEDWDAPTPMDRLLVQRAWKPSALDFTRFVPSPACLQVGGSQYEPYVQREHPAPYREPLWYTWSCNNWGTKWNACDVQDPDVSEQSASVRFDTAWGPSTEIADAMARRFPQLKITHDWAETGMNFCGYRVYEDGELASEDAGTLNDGSYVSDRAMELFGLHEIYEDEDDEEDNDDGDAEGDAGAGGDTSSGDAGAEVREQAGEGSAG